LEKKKRSARRTNKVENRKYQFFFYLLDVLDGAHEFESKTSIQRKVYLRAKHPSNK